ncbi:hypothetical protein BLNAU_14910 [Blattamonas nauphoetae]|uniref:Uncharacterized protein n=1 Tax=Blattamonas nauphoetae TaxID=2049346 RepID=A0ABQ9XC77_9EUKA|nr:hypothetical protein BLNAU_14910 [Blattamonas nauphoetae]
MITPLSFSFRVYHTALTAPHPDLIDSFLTAVEISSSPSDTPFRHDRHLNLISALSQSSSPLFTKLSEPLLDTTIPLDSLISPRSFTDPASSFVRMELGASDHTKSTSQSICAEAGCCVYLMSRSEISEPDSPIDFASELGIQFAGCLVNALHSTTTLPRSFPFFSPDLSGLSEQPRVNLAAFDHVFEIAVLINNLPLVAVTLSQSSSPLFTKLSEPLLGPTFTLDSLLSPRSFTDPPRSYFRMANTNPSFFRRLVETHARHILDIAISTPVMTVRVGSDSPSEPHCLDFGRMTPNAF